MKNNTARKLSQIPPGYLIMGIDPHKKLHVAVAMTQDTIIHTKFKFANSRQGSNYLAMHTYLTHKQDIANRRIAKFFS